MKIYITGATGFVGSCVVAAAIARGHDVVAVVRPSSSGIPKTNNVNSGSPSDVTLVPGSISAVRVDLRSLKGLTDSLAGVDSVIHLAAAKEGDFYTQFAGTVVATENLLAAMGDAGVTKLVGISTFSVYDYLHTRPGTLIDEYTPLDTAPALRDEYAQTKLIQEELYQDFGAVEGHHHVILRPGMIYGPGNLWHDLLGAELGQVYLRIGSKATLPMTYVENCAEAIVLAAENLAVEPLDAVHSSVDGEVINIVDDDLPTQAEYAELVASMIDTPKSISIPWPVIRTAAGALKKGNEVLLGGRAKFPGIAIPDRLHARFKPLRYDNAKAKRLLGWEPRYTLREAVMRSAGKSTT